jgi:hypothetical protein
MSKLIHRPLAFLFTLTLAGIASARQPPALTAAQERSEAVFATCAQSESTPGYRDMLARVESAKPASADVVASLATRKMGDHLVLVCAGGELHQGSGYRDFPARFRSEPEAPLVASIAALASRH